MTPRTETRDLISALIRKWMSGGALTDAERQAVTFLALDTLNSQLRRAA